MVIALLNNLPELLGFCVTVGLSFYAGRRFERWRKS